MNVGAFDLCSLRLVPIVIIELRMMWMDECFRPDRALSLLIALVQLQHFEQIEWKIGYSKCSLSSDIVVVIPLSGCFPYCVPSFNQASPSDFWSLAG